MQKESQDVKISKAEVRKWRLKSITFGISMPLLLTLILFLFNKDQILWPFQDHSKWRTTHGEIVSSKIEYQGGWRNIGWHFRIVYKYEVNKKTYLSNHIHYSFTGSSNETYAENYVAKYPVGANVTVYYDPAHPEQAVLEPLVKDYSNLYTIGGALIFGLYFVISSFWIR